MTLFEVIQKLKDIALQQPNVRSVSDGDIYETLNANPSSVYSIFHITQQTHREDEDYDYWGFNLFYVDRLTDDYQNRLKIQSIGKSVLSNVVRIFCEQNDIDFPDETQISFNSFTEKFVDLTAGMYCNLTLTIPKNLICGDEYEAPIIEIDKNGTYYIGGYKVKVEI